MEKKQFLKYIDSPIGLIEISTNENALLSIEFVKNTKENDSKSSQGIINENPEIMKDTINQLNEYFNGTRTEFDLKLQIKGTEFQQKSWAVLQTIKYGETISYQDQAIKVGNPKAVRAVAGANHNNNIAIVIPCHRVIGKDGSLTGYGGGIWRKEWLLNHEKLNRAKYL